MQPCPVKIFPGLVEVVKSSCFTIGEVLGDEASGEASPRRKEIGVDSFDECLWYLRKTSSVEKFGHILLCFLLVDDITIVCKRRCDVLGV